MSHNAPSRVLRQHFEPDEQLFRRVRVGDLHSSGTKALLTGFSLPDMSVNRSTIGTAEDARRGFEKTDWAVVVFTVNDLPPKQELMHIDELYELKVRHDPLPGNDSHSEVRIWKKINGDNFLITNKVDPKFLADDPDVSEKCITDSLLNPDFHMKWRKRISLIAKIICQIQQVAA